MKKNNFYKISSNKRTAAIPIVLPKLPLRQQPHPQIPNSLHPNQISRQHTSLIHKIQSFLKNPSFAEHILRECLIYLKNSDNGSNNENKSTVENGERERSEPKVRASMQEQWGVQSQIIYVKRDDVQKIQSKVLFQRMQGIRSDFLSPGSNADFHPKMNSQIQNLQSKIQQLTVENQLLRTSLEETTKQTAKYQLQLLDAQNLKEKLLQHDEIHKFELQRQKQSSILQMYELRIQSSLKEDEIQRLKAKNAEIEDCLQRREAESISLWQLCERYQPTLMAI